MSEAYSELSSVAQTAYAQLFESAQARHMLRPAGDLNGSFAKKDVKGTSYWYFQYRDIDGKVRQIYVGPDNERVQQLIKKRGTPSMAPIDRLAASAVALGCAPVLPKHFRIIRRLAEYGFFKAGGVLIGTHAFIAMGNMLGVHWADGARTQDVDFAHAGKSISIALPSDIRIDVHKAIDSLEMGFLPIHSFNGSSGASYLNPDEPELKIDFLTPLTRAGAKPFDFKELNIALQPLKFMEFSLEETTQGAIFSREGALLVNLPSPIRYGLHKLIVYGEREGAYRTKSLKDIMQSNAILSYYARHMPEALSRNLDDLLSRGPGWRKRAEHGIKAVLRLNPGLETVLLRPSAQRGARNTKTRNTSRPPG